MTFFRGGVAAGLVWASAAAGQSPTPAPKYSLDDFTQLALARHPQLARAGFAVDAARGRATQAGLYPNPKVELRGDEFADRTGQRGILTLPGVSQEIVTKNKLGLDRAAGNKEADQAVFAAAARRASLLASVRAAYFDVAALQRRIDLLGPVVTSADAAVDRAGKLLAAKIASRLDVLQLEVEAEKYRAEKESAERELPAAFRRLAVAAGVPDLPAADLAGGLDLPLPDYDLDRVRTYAADNHPDVQSALAGVERARLVLRRAEVEPVPNVTVSAAFVRQNQNRSNDFSLGVGMPVPVWNRNQGAIFAAKADLGAAVREVEAVRLDVTDRVAAAAREFASNRARAEKYRAVILPRAAEAYELAQAAYRAGNFDYIKLLEAQRTLAQANLERAKALGDAWRAASAISGLTLEEAWPPK